MRIIASQLEGLACPDQVALFRKLYGSSVEVTEAGCCAVADKFDWSWAAAHLLDATALAEYRRAMVSTKAEYGRAGFPLAVEYERATASAREAYKQATAPPTAECERASALVEYGQAMFLPWVEYERATAPLLAEYQRGKAAAFARACVGMDARTNGLAQVGLNDGTWSESTSES